jgi:hypothetical protein
LRSFDVRRFFRAADCPSIYPKIVEYLSDSGALNKSRDVCVFRDRNSGAHATAASELVYLDAGAT